MYVLETFVIKILYLHRFISGPLFCSIDFHVCFYDRTMMPLLLWLCIVKFDIRTCVASIIVLSV